MGGMNTVRYRNLDVMRDALETHGSMNVRMGNFAITSLIWQDITLTNFIPFQLGQQNIYRCTVIILQCSVITNPFGPGVPTVVAVRDGSVGPNVPSGFFKGIELLPGQAAVFSVDESDLTADGKQVYLEPKNFWIELVTAAAIANPIQVVHVAYGILEVAQ